MRGARGVRITSGRGAARRTRLIVVARRLWPLPVLLVVFLTVGLPSRLVGDGPAARDGDAVFATVCHEHGGTILITPPSPSFPRAERRCAVRYAGTEYVLDAVTPHGWDDDAARLQQSGCEEANRQRATRPRKSRVRFVYHATTGICERRG